MATQKFSGVVEPGTPQEVAMTNLARFGVIFRDGPLELAMVEPLSEGKVPVNNGAENYGSHVGEMVGETLVLTATGANDVNVTVYEE